MSCAISLRAFAESDFEPMAELMGDPDAMKYMSWGPRSRDESRAAFDKRLAAHNIKPDADYLALAVIDTASGALAGEVSLMKVGHLSRNMEAGYMLRPDFHGRGMATAAMRTMMKIGFDQMGQHRIIASCDDRNTASARVMEKCGMRREAHFIRSEWVKGEWTSAFVYALLADEWRAQNVRR
jgi:RimJ/RimL family protein N-acetyltransferase